MKRRAQPLWRRLIRDLRHGSEWEATQASNALPRCRSRKCREQMVALMFEKGEPWRGEKAAYAFLWGRDRQAIPALVNCVCDESVYETIRGQAAEALIRLLPDPPAKDDRWPSAEAALLKGLNDPSPIVRFWCCFALGSLKSQKAIVPLEMLCRTDQALVRGWWYVHEEAEDALAMIAGRSPKDRLPIHMREAEAG